MSQGIQEVLAKCRSVLPEWKDLTDDEFEWDPPKGFSSFTLSIRATRAVEPQAVLYRGLDGKDNAILDFENEQAVFQLLSREQIAAQCYYSDATCRIEQFFEGRTLTPADLADSGILKGIAAELYRFHQLTPERLPQRDFFSLLHEKWSELGRAVLVDRRDEFSDEEQALFDDLLEMYTPETAVMVQRCLPDSPMVFSHNDTYHGNVMLLDNGDIKLLDFEFSCLNHPAFDFSNLFAETVMQHGLAEAPHFRFAEPEYTRDDVTTLVSHYVDCGHLTGSEREAEIERLVDETEDMILLSHYMYAMAAIPLAAEPIQKIRFIPYAHARWLKFQESFSRRARAGTGTFQK